jgi:hypothetical protein
MKRILLLVFVAALTAHTAPFLAADNRGEPDYYPLKPGTKWNYQVTAQGKTVKVSNVIDKIEEVKGQSLAVQKTIVNGAVGATEKLSANRQGVFRHQTNNIDTTPPICLIKYPVKPGDSWEGEHQSGPDKSKVTVKVGKFEEIKVPAGKYKTISATLTTNVKGQNVTTTYWFADNVGIVKQTAMIGGLNVLMELEKFEPAK